MTSYDWPKVESFCYTPPLRILLFIPIKLLLSITPWNSLSHFNISIIKFISTSALSTDVPFDSLRIPRCSEPLFSDQPAALLAKLSKDLQQLLVPSPQVLSSQNLNSPHQLSKLQDATPQPAGLNKAEVEGRILSLLSNFDKVSALSATAHFSNDLGLDSLDTVEVVMAIEEEFSIEIPDKDADSILSVEQAVEYILHQPDAH
ncbi:hypothetical protein EYC84_009168 [Monilinia fructicola]|uniref:Acyl carrier protein n=1 Tax=Monilinia fructicola TaxID=38448 RepID=A0A5M9JHN2_MONFR|nr:hypothetical protein EYC84_009168 [Monilinia fructicola]